MVSPRTGIVIGLRITNPALTLNEIGENVHLSRERVRKILKKAGLPTKRKKFCALCGKERPHATKKWFIKGKLRSLCADCNSLYQERADGRIRNAWITLTCEYCKKHFERRCSVVRHRKKRGQKHIFCGKKCFGAWAGKNSGFVMHPENSGRKKKYNYEAIANFKKMVNVSYSRLGFLIGVDGRTIHIICKRMGT